ncbi:MAG: TolC family outer membrane protein [Sterolibacterium sp.]|nr:TolC family outer membrane protein [Sterolibacterium sp.]
MKLRPSFRFLARPALLAALGLATVTVATPATAVDLLQSYRLAVQNDARYQAARAEAAASREAEPQALAQLLPNVGLSLQRSDRSSDIWAPGMFGRVNHSRQDYMSSNYAVTLRQPLYRRFNFALYQQSHAQVTSSEAILDRNFQDLLIRLSAAYFDALLAEDHQRLVQAYKETCTAQLQSAKRRFEAGQGTRTDIDDAQARYDMALAQELEADQSLEQKRRELQIIIKQPVQQVAALVPQRLELMAPYPADIEEWVRRGQDINPELRALRANIAAAEQEVAKASAGHHPTLDLVAQRSRSSSDGENLINQEYLTTSVGLQLNIPLFAGGYYSSQVRQAEAGLDKVRQQYEGRRREIDLAIRKEFQGVTQGMLKVKAQEQAERSADQAVLSSQKGYQAGQRTVVDILNAQQQRINVRRDLANARYQYILSRLRLLSLAGNLGEEEMTAVNLWLDRRGETSASATAPDNAADASRNTSAATVPAPAAGKAPTKVLARTVAKPVSRNVTKAAAKSATNAAASVDPVQLQVLLDAQQQFGAATRAASTLPVPFALPAYLDRLSLCHVDTAADAKPAPEMEPAPEPAAHP